MKLHISTKIIIGFSLIIFCALISFWFNIRLSSEVTRNTEYVTNSEAVIRNSAKIHRTILTMQNSFRGYLLTEDPTFLEAYYGGLAEMPVLVAEERAILQNSYYQIRRLDSIESLQKEWILYSKAIIDAKIKKLDPAIESSEYDDLFENKLKKRFGKNITDKISIKLRAFERHEYSLRKYHREKLNASIHTARKVNIIMAVITISVGIMSAVYITHQITKRIKTMVQLAENISKGTFDFIHDQENDELTELSSSLNIMSEKLKKSFLELDQFAYVVSHDLKAPLRGIYNIVHWMEEDFGKEMSSTMQGYMEKLRGRIHRMENLISGLLEYSKIGRTQQSLELVKVDKLIEEITDTLEPTECIVHIQKPMPSILTEKLRLQQVFSNLISNAVKYKSNTICKISVSCKQLKDQYQFTVSDNGVGIDQEYHTKIFGLFQTLREKHQAESTGIGLSIVKKIIEDKKGTIFIISEPGKGSSFIFTWPK